MKYLILVLIFVSFNVFAVRPSPQKTTAEVLNDVYDDFDGATHTAALWVNLVDKSLTITSANTTITEGVHVDFTVTNIAAGSYTTIHTLANNSRYMSITHNGGGKFLLAVNGSAVGVIAPGEVQYVNFYQSAGDTIGLQSESGTISTGDIYLNFFGE
jgi:hypothetical protein